MEYNTHAERFHLIRIRSNGVLSKEHHSFASTNIIAPFSGIVNSAVKIKPEPFSLRCSGVSNKRCFF